MIDVRMRQHHRGNVFARERKVPVALFGFFPASLIQAAIQQIIYAFDRELMHGAGDHCAAPQNVSFILSIIRARVGGSAAVRVAVGRRQCAWRRCAWRWADGDARWRRAGGSAAGQCERPWYAHLETSNSKPELG